MWTIDEMNGLIKYIVRELFNNYFNNNSSNAAN